MCSILSVGCMESIRLTGCFKMAPASACQHTSCTTSWRQRTRMGARVQATCAASRKTMAAPAKSWRSWTVPCFPALQLRSYCSPSVRRMPSVRPPLGARASKQEEPKKHSLGKQETKSNLVRGQSSDRSKSLLRPESLSIHKLSQGPSRADAHSAAVYPQPGDISQVKCAHGEAVILKDGKSPVPLSGSLGDATCHDSRSSVAHKKRAQTLPHSNVHTEHPGAERAVSHQAPSPHSHLADPPLMSSRTDHHSSTWPYSSLHKLRRLVPEFARLMGGVLLLFALVRCTPRPAWRSERGGEISHSQSTSQRSISSGLSAQSSTRRLQPRIR